MTNLLLGPIVGHTDSGSSQVWIRVEGEIDGWQLDVAGRPAVPFVATDPVRNEFGTAIARIEGLQPDTAYEYGVLSGVSTAARGSFRTMPLPDAAADISFVSLSCNDARGPGAWHQLANLSLEVPLRFILMHGDQVYLDDEDDDLWSRHLDSGREERRRAFAAMYQAAWSQQPIASLMANTPTYMVWDDHDIRDGWGSSAGDSPTLAARYPQGQAIHSEYRAWFEDARDVYFHFQACRNPAGERALTGAAPFVVRCGRLALVVVDQRSERDFARETDPVLGSAQWQWLTKTLDTLDDNVDAIALASGIPIVDMQPDNAMHQLFVDRTDDIKQFAKGDAKRLEKTRSTLSNRLALAACLALAKTVDRGFRLGRWLGLGAAETDDGRDRWSCPHNRPEQERLLRLLACSTKSGSRTQPRGLVFLGGDIHVGALFDLTFAEPDTSAQCLIASGISQKILSRAEIRAGVLDTDFDVVPGIHARLKELITEPNFGLTRLRFGNGASQLSNVLIGSDTGVVPSPNLAGD